MASSSSSTPLTVPNTQLVVRLADGTTHHLVPIDTLTDSSLPSPSSTPPIPIPPPDLRHRSLVPSINSDSDSDSSNTAINSDSDSDSDVGIDNPTTLITVSRHINPAHAAFLQTRINTPLF